MTSDFKGDPILIMKVTNFKKKIVVDTEVSVTE